ncbi:hypothetical protein F4778DRAFT_9076 [Xylariomycetidae sp. FL2044]|nr:hypothetical protein F4778DRAFT_9076 [Xylariomycetidae sp. FL2044]
MPLGPSVLRTASHITLELCGAGVFAKRSIGGSAVLLFRALTVLIPPSVCGNSPGPSARPPIPIHCPPLLWSYSQLSGSGLSALFEAQGTYLVIWAVNNHLGRASAMAIPTMQVLPSLVPGQIPALPGRLRRLLPGLLPPGPLPGLLRLLTIIQLQLQPQLQPQLQHQPRIHLQLPLPAYPSTCTLHFLIARTETDHDSSNRRSENRPYITRVLNNPHHHHHNPNHHGIHRDPQHHKP